MWLFCKPSYVQLTVGSLAPLLQWADSSSAFLLWWLETFFSFLGHTSSWPFLSSSQSHRKSKLKQTYNNMSDALSKVLTWACLLFSSTGLIHLPEDVLQELILHIEDESLRHRGSIQSRPSSTNVLHGWTRERLSWNSEGLQSPGVIVSPPEQCLAAVVFHLYVVSTTTASAWCNQDVQCHDQSGLEGGCLNVVS